MSGSGDRIDRVVAAVTAVDGVVGLHSGPGVPVTYLPGRTVSGIRLGSNGGSIHVILELRGALLDIAERAQQAAIAAAGVPIDVVVGDVAIAETRLPDATPRRTS